MLDVNLIAPCMLIAEAEAALRKSAGRACIVNIGTHAGVRPKGSSIPYAAAKAACTTTTLCWRWPWGLTSASIAWRRALSRRRWQRAGEAPSYGTPDRRCGGRPSPRTSPIWWPSSVANDYVTGEIVIADGGLNLT